MSDEDTTTAGEGELDFRTPEGSDDEDNVGGANRAPREPPTDTGTGTASDRPTTSSGDAPVEIQLPDELDAALTPEAVR